MADFSDREFVTPWANGGRATAFRRRGRSTIALLFQLGWKFPGAILARITPGGCPAQPFVNPPQSGAGDTGPGVSTLVGVAPLKTLRSLGHLWIWVIEQVFMPVRRSCPDQSLSDKTLDRVESVGGSRL